MGVTRVVRFESKYDSSLGLYNVVDYYEWSSKDCDILAEAPRPMIEFTTKHYFGFSAVEQVHEYFRKKLQRAMKLIKEHEYDIVVAVYDVPDIYVLHDTCQCAFMLDKAECVSRTSIYEIDRLNDFLKSVFRNDNVERGHERVQAKHG